MEYARVAYTNAAAAADYYRRHFQQLPESVLYLSDIFAGLTQGEKPANYPDTMEIENHQLRAIFRSDETLPHALYDYTIPWTYADWGNGDIPRKPDGYVVPNTEDRCEVLPRRSGSFLSFAEGTGPSSTMAHCSFSSASGDSVRSN